MARNDVPLGRKQTLVQHAMVLRTAATYSLRFVKPGAVMSCVGTAQFFSLK